jgi:hypothetical protein
MESDTTTQRTISVEPAQQGVDIKPVKQKKPLTEAQLAALKRGRAKLAERRAKERGEDMTAVQPDELQQQQQEQEANTVEAPPEDLKTLPQPTDAAVQTDAPPLTEDEDQENEQEEDSGGGMCVIM